MDNNELESRFTYHAPKPGQLDKYTALRNLAKDFATMINVLVPDSREKSLAITKVEEAIMWANAGIARRE